VERDSFSIWMWDGEYYRYMWSEYVAPLYRFQAAFDGDYFTSLGLDDRAEVSYSNTINSSTLKPGSSVDWRRDHNCYIGEDEKPDTTEPQRIKAYARFRMVELFAKTNSLSKAKAQWQFLKDNYLLNTPGHIYAYLANVFWQEFQKKEDISAACALVREESEKNKDEVFALFGEYGFGNPGPTVDDICPFFTPPAE
jgi:hypothetical protein